MENINSQPSSSFTQEIISDDDWVKLFSDSDINLEKILLQKPESETDRIAIATDGDLDRDHGGLGSEFGYGKGKRKRVGKGIKKDVFPRIAFHTKSVEDVLDDGYRWRKYGQKAVKYTTHPRSYYRCTHHTCNVKKQIQRHSKDPTIVVTTYEGIHNHPCEKLMETLSPLLKQLQFLSSI